ncbi:hypothetical protein NEOLEDRAFT_1150312 [Neolentinus lepideus HHB14362 ss-1]|uniref:Uncharacterized protein n=1 Tax=Neolentinus lepideus HHB14362 ss-1 TaxID=1314782 RepID=A0A165Q7J2_9AGAM|nr:hypothetical protein NEOLEDRAFT_1150312 [Neolentinus lepideus HHB14362 ss-1]
MIQSPNRNRPAAAVIKSKRRFAALWQLEATSLASKMPISAQSSKSHSHHVKEDSFELNFSESGLALHFPRPPPSPISPLSKTSRASTPSLFSCFSGETTTTESSFSEIASRLDEHGARRGPSDDGHVSQLSLPEDESFLPSLSDDEDDDSGLSVEDDVEDDGIWYTQQLEGLLVLPSLSQPQLPSYRGTNLSAIGVKYTLTSLIYRVTHDHPRGLCSRIDTGIAIAS